MSKDGVNGNFIARSTYISLLKNSRYLQGQTLFCSAEDRDPCKCTEPLFEKHQELELAIHRLR
jgi:hypothetical protein